MDKLKWVCFHYEVNLPQELIDMPGQGSKDVTDHLLTLNFLDLDQEAMTKLSLIRNDLAKIKHQDNSETIFGRYIWMKEAKTYCDTLYNQYYKSGILGHALKNEEDFREPVGFLSIRKYVLEKFNEYEDLYLKELKNRPYWDLPDPEKIADEFCNPNRNKSGQYKVHEIIPVMRKAAEYIFEKKLTDINRHVKPIVDACSDYAGRAKAQRNWVTFYARKSGLKVPDDDAE